MARTHRFDHAPFLVTPEERVRLKDHDPAYTAGLKNKKEGKAALREDVEALAEMQELLWASSEYSVLVIFQALDAAGKDGAIKHVMSGVNPQGCEVRGFKAPGEEELLHHFLWRPARALPARGRIGIFNRSYYEEVLVVRVHPEFLQRQKLPRRDREADLSRIWAARYEEINGFERMLAENNVCIIKFFLNVSKQEQRERFLDRLENPDKHWKFSPADLRERGYWDQYTEAYEDMLSATSTPWAPWYIVPADRKWFTRACVADILTSRVADLNLSYPQTSEEHEQELVQAKRELEREAGGSEDAG